MGGATPSDDTETAEVNPTSKVTAALIAGAATGLFYVIPLVNCLCCVWGIGGGVLASYLWLRHQPPSLSPPLGDGLLLGMLTSGVGTVTWLFLQVPLQIFTGFAQDPGESLEQMEEMMETMAPGTSVPEWLTDIMGSTSGTIGMGLIGTFFFAIFVFIALAIFVSIGSLIGTAIFHKKAQ